MPYVKRPIGPYHLDTPTEDERLGRSGTRYRMVIRHILRPSEFVFRFERAGRDCRDTLAALNNRDTLLRVLLADDDEIEAAA